MRTTLCILTEPTQQKHHLAGDVWLRGLHYIVMQFETDAAVTFTV